MKIGVLTFHRARNFGGILQCYALVQYLNRCGYDVEVVDYVSKSIESTYSLIRTDGLKNFLRSLYKIRYSWNSRKLYRRFILNNIPVSKRKYYSSEDFSGEYDLLLIGSDQVWSKRINKGFDEIYWGNIMTVNRKIAYAVSMGTDHNFSKKENELIAKYLKNFDKISVREDSLKKEMSFLTNKSIYTVIDPTLLLEIDDYKKIAQFPKEENYILYYQMEMHPDCKERVKELALQLDCPIVVIGVKPEAIIDVEVVFYDYGEVSPSQFVGYIYNAKCVITSSFHGVALSIAMRKDFYSLKLYASDRAENLLRHVGAVNRLISPSHSISFSPVDYEYVVPKLEKFTNYSKDFLHKNI